MIEWITLWDYFGNRGILRSVMKSSPLNRIQLLDCWTGGAACGPSAPNGTGEAEAVLSMEYPLASTSGTALEIPPPPAKT